MCDKEHKELLGRSSLKEANNANICNKENKEHSGKNSFTKANYGNELMKKSSLKRASGPNIRDNEHKELLRKSSLKGANENCRQKKRRHVLIRVPESDQDGPYKLRTKVLLATLVVLVFAAALLGYLLGNKRRPIEVPDPYYPLPPSPSKLHTFQKAAVCTDAPKCSEIGRNILANNGSAIDAAIAAAFCNGLYNHQSMGLGGGFVMMVYIKEEEKAYAVIARETAPAAASRDMFKENPSLVSKGALSAAIPGELRGYWAIYQRWGKLPWASLLAPTIKICEEGFRISQALFDSFEMAPYMKNDYHLRNQYYNKEKGQFRRAGSLVKPSEALCNTLRRIAEAGGDDLYNGTLAEDLAEDLLEVKSIITAEDLRNYQARIEEPIAIPIGNGDTLYSPAPPASGVILANILTILNGYHFSPDSINSTEDKILTYHRIIEAFKYAYGMRTKLGDTAFVNLTEIMKNATDPVYGEQIRLRINDTSTSNDSSVYGATVYNKADSGTAHISIIASNGDAVSVTSSINMYFGAGFTTKRTGILMNNVMDDFSSPGVTNYFGVKPAPANFIEPNKRPLSSMTPSIVVDSNGNAKIVIGASGGTKITTAIALTIMRMLWFDQTIKEAVDEARFHHQTIPMIVGYEYGIIEDILAGLRAKGHGIERYRGRGSIVCALFRNSTMIYANSDFRKGGDVAGLD